MTAVDINEHEMVGAGRCRVRAGLVCTTSHSLKVCIALAEYL
jgi:hypothetical protein